MAKLKSTLPNMFLSLTIICVVAGAILAGVNMYTTGPIAATKAAALEAAIKAVTPAFDNKPTEEAYIIGISQENLDKIWQRFYQADPSRQENAGLGLGLSMVQQIVTLHGGAVAVTSAPGHGTTFTVTLPEHHGKEES